MAIRSRNKKFASRNLVGVLLLMLFLISIGGGIISGCEMDELSRELQGIMDRMMSREEQPLTEPPEPPAPPEDDYAPAPPSDLNEEYRLSKFYYPEKEKKLLIPVTRKIPYQEGIARATVEELVDQPQLRELLKKANLVPALPEGTEVIGMAINDHTARINFNAHFLDYPEEEERLVLGSLQGTLKQFSDIEKVQVLIEGSILEEFPGGTSGKSPLGPASRINLEVDEELENYQEHTSVVVFMVYPVSEKQFFHVPVTRVMQPQEDALEAAIKELLHGARKRPGLFSSFPPDVKLLNLEREAEDEVHIKLSREVIDYRGGRTGEENMINQLVLTVMANTSAEKIIMDVEGEEHELPYGTDLNAPLPLPSTINYLEEP